MQAALSGACIDDLTVTVRAIGRRLPRPAGGLADLRLHGPDAPGRGEVEAFIRAVYRERYGADVRQFAPVLVSLHDEHGELRGRRRLPRGATSGRCSWSATCRRRWRRCCRRAAGRGRARQRIVEVGHLAAARAGEGRRLILLLGPHLATPGFRVGGQHADAGTAQPVRAHGRRAAGAGRGRPGACWATQAAQWGSYYDHRPLVLAGRLDAALQMLARRERRRMRPALDDGRRRWSAAELRRRRGRGRRRRWPRPARACWPRCWTTRRPSSRSTRRRCSAASCTCRCRSSSRAAQMQHALQAAGVDTLLVGAAAGRAPGRACAGRPVDVAGEPLMQARLPAAPVAMPARHGEDHLHLRHHRRAQGRVPGRRRPCSAWPHGLVEAMAPLRHRAPPERAALRRAAGEHRRPDGAAPAGRHGA